MKVVWPPKVTRGSKTLFRVDGSSGHVSLDGQPTVVKLNRLHLNDKSIRGDVINECCDCGSVHLYAYEVIRSNNEFYLLKRPYRIKDGHKTHKTRKTRKK